MYKKSNNLISCTHTVSPKTSSAKSAAELARRGRGEFASWRGVGAASEQHLQRWGKYIWNLFKIYLEYIWNIFEIDLKLIWNIFEIYLKYV